MSISFQKETHVGRFGLRPLLWGQESEEWRDPGLSPAPSLPTAEGLCMDTLLLAPRGWGREQVAGVGSVVLALPPPSQGRDVDTPRDCRMFAPSSPKAAGSLWGRSPVAASAPPAPWLLTEVSPDGCVKGEQSSVILSIFF